MPDILQDFVFTRLAANASDTDTVITVDNVTQLPSAGTLAKGYAWLVFESALTYPPTFEIVKLTAVDSGNSQITVVRGQGGTTAVAHITGTYLKGALTSDILRRARSGFSGTSVPSADSTIYNVGDRFTNSTTGAQYVYIGSGFVPLSGVPTGGTTGQALRKNSATDYDASWASLHEVPAGGASGQSLVKNSSTDYDYSWSTVSGGGGADATAMHYKGAFSTSVNYAANDVVTYNNGLYVCTTPVVAGGPSYIGATQQSHANTATTISLPSGAAASDIAVLTISTYAGVTPSITWTGSTSQFAGNNANVGLAMSTKQMDSTDITAGSISYTPNLNGYATLMVFRNVTVSTTKSSATSQSIPVITTSSAAYVLKAAAQLINGGATPGITPSQTATVAVTAPSGGYQTTLVTAYEAQAVAGASTAATATLSGSDLGYYLTFALALTEAASGFPSSSFAQIGLLSAMQTRQTATATTSSLASAASTTATAMPLSVGFQLYTIQTSRPARVQLYTTAAAMTADASRPVGTDPGSTAGVILDYVTTGSSAYSLSPIVEGANLESTPSSNISMRVTNQDTSTGTVAVTLVWLKTE